MFQINKNAKYAVLTATSMGLRIMPVDKQPVYATNLFEMQVTSAESNALSVVSALGYPTLALTAFVKDCPMATKIKRDLKSRGIAYAGPEIEKKGPWGVRHQINIADGGFGLRGQGVTNDRAGEVAKELSTKDFDLDAIFKEGIGILHISGLFAALSSNTGDLCLQLVKKAKEYGAIVSFDLNYRSSFWANREEELQKLFVEIAQLSDILFGNNYAYAQCFGLPYLELEFDFPAAKITLVKNALQAVQEKFPHVKLHCHTIREELSANENLWGAIIANGNEYLEIAPTVIDVLDRIGGGDAFAGGFLYGLLQGYELKGTLDFAWAAGVMAVGVKQDYILPQCEDELWRIVHRHTQVLR